MDNSNHIPEQLIEESLNQRPLAPLPPGFVDGVMAQVQAGQVETPRETIRFRLELLDIALAVLGACLVVLALGLSGELAILDIAAPVTSSLGLPAIVWLPEPEWIFSNWLALVGLLAFTELCVGALFCTWMWLDRPLSLTAV